MSHYPEHDKLTKPMSLSEFTQQLGEWLDEHNYAVCELVCRSCGRPPHARHGGLSDAEWSRVPIGGGMSGLLAEMFGVDADHLEAEKRAMLDMVRNPGQSPGVGVEPGAWWCDQHEAWH